MSYKDDLVMKIATSNSCELVALQYQALIENTEDLKNFILQKDDKNSFEKLDKIRDIISNLIASLGEENTDFREKTIDLYLYIVKSLNYAKIKKDTKDIPKIIGMFQTLRDAWNTAGEKLEDNENLKNISNAITYGKTDINIQGSTSDFGRG